MSKSNNSPYYMVKINNDHGEDDIVNIQQIDGAEGSFCKYFLM